MSKRVPWEVNEAAGMHTVSVWIFMALMSGAPGVAGTLLTAMLFSVFAANLTGLEPAAGAALTEVA